MEFSGVGCQILVELNLYLFCWKIASASFWDFGAKPISTSKLEFGGFVCFVVSSALKLICYITEMNIMTAFLFLLILITVEIFSAAMR